RAVFRREGGRPGTGVLRLMVEYVGTRHQRARAARRAARAHQPLPRRLDWWLVAAVAGAVAYGLWAIAGITRHDIPGDPSYFVIRQGVYAAVGGLGLVGALLVDPSFYRRYWRALFRGAVGLKVLAILAGSATRRSKRRTHIGLFPFQPSEFR